MQKNVLIMPTNYEDAISDLKFKKELKFIIPDRYVWHVKDQGLMSDISIAESGLVRGMHGMVFAHSFLKKFYNTYPYCVHGCFEGFDTRIASPFSYFSYWRIDTRMFDAKWYIDPNMRDECDSGYAGVYKNYICTDTDIPLHALKNFTFSRERFENRNPIIRSVEGVSSYYSLENDFDTLVPNDVINGFMQRQMRKAI